MFDIAADLARHLDPFSVANSIGLQLDAWQAELLESQSERILLNVTRQGGKSTTSAVLAVNTAITDPGLILVASPSQRQSGELFRKITGTLRDMQPAPEFELQSSTKLELENGSRIVALPGSEATVRGYSAPRLVLIDEASRVEDDLYAALRPMLATSESGRLICLSTPWGRRGFFFNGWEFGGDTWQRFRVPASECPRISKEFLDEELREIGPLRFASEYCCEFIDADDQLFPSALIERALSDEVRPIW
jgi:hypothetical protein